MKTTAYEIHKEIENARNYKSQNKVFDNAATNERMVKGDQWHGMNTKNLPPNVYNFIGQVEKTQISSVMSQQISITRSADATSKDNPEVVRAASIFTQLDKDNWERCKMDTVNEDVLEDSFVTGLGGTYWFWDDDIRTGNDFVTVGDFRSNYIDAVNFYVSEPSLWCVQSQEWIAVTRRMTEGKARSLFKAKGVPQNELELIKSDESTVYEAYDKAQVEQETSYSQGELTVYAKFYKEKGNVWCVYSTETVSTKPWNTGLTKYPAAIMNWEKRKSFIYGVSPVTQVVANQKTANIQSAMRHLHAQLLAIPKMGYNKNMIPGMSNQVGGIYEMDVEPGADLSRAMYYFQPTSITFDLDKSIDQSIERTKTLMGANQALLGESNPDNFRAILAQQKQAGIPLESVKRRFYQYIEDVAEIWLDFYQHKYNMARMVVNDEMQEIFVGTEFEGIYLNTKVDVGASTQMNELIQIELADKLWEMGILQQRPELYIDMLPDFNKKTEVKKIFEQPPPTPQPEIPPQALMQNIAPTNQY